ncbi:MAG: DUF6352 family protein, partial [Pseudomonadota bacterium]|nr:DUF6352 family protein [Pseudomonadota bacterium]
MSEADDTHRSDLAPNPLGRWLAPAEGFFRPLLALPELALVDPSCAGERRLHERLVAAPTRAVAAAELE